MPDRDQPQPTDTDAARRATILIGLGAPAVITTFAVWLQLMWRGDLPDPVATHWSGLGAPDGFGAPWMYPVMTAVFGFAVPSVFSLIGLRSIHHGEGGAVPRMLTASALGMSTLFAVQMTWSVADQRGLADAVNAPNPWPGILFGVLAGLCLSVAGWHAQPELPVPLRRHYRPGTVPLDPDDPLSWQGYSSASGALRAAVWAPATLMFVVGIAIAMRSSLGGISLIIASVIIALVAALTMRFKVQVSSAGLEVRSVVGWPAFRVPIDDIDDVSVTEVQGFTDFGGWGVRKMPGAFGIIMSNGDALHVTRLDGRRLVVTIDHDSEQAAAILGSYVQAHRDRAEKPH